MADLQKRPMIVQRKLVNVTPHPIHIQVAGKIVSIEPERFAARCVTVRNTEFVVPVQGLHVAINTTSYGRLDNLPPPRVDTLYIVSYIALQAAKQAGRKDCIAVDELIRDQTGQVVACASFQQ